VVRFPVDDPSKVETFKAGLAVRALALDARGNLWVASNTSPDFPMPPVPEGASIMKQFKTMGRAALMYKKPTGIVTMIRPDGGQRDPAGYNGNGAVNVPWGLNVDGNGTNLGGQLQRPMLTDVSIDAAGNVWAANNWNSPEAAVAEDPAYPTSTWGGGSGLTVIYGVAAPVKPPRMGPVKTY